MIRGRLVGRSRLVSWGRLVGWGRLVSWGRVVFGGRGVFWGRLVFIIMGFAAVSNFSNVSGVSIIRVSHSLGTTIGQENMVRSAGSISVSGFILTKVESSIVILDGIVVVVGRVGVFIFGFMVRWGGFV